MSTPGATAQISLHPDHLSDLRRSGLSDETIVAAGIRSLAPGEWSKHLGQRIAGKITSACLFPYPGGDGFYRVKLFPPASEGDGHAIRYYQPAGTGPRLYIPPRARAAVADPSVLLRWTEGEKKALKADQEGLACLALGGLWSWLVEGRPIDDLDHIDHVGRTEILTPDAEVWTRPELLQAVYAFGKELETRGATVLVEKLPADAQGGKVGLDDFLCARSVAELEALAKLPLKHTAFSRVAEWWKGWRKRKAEAASLHADVLELLERGETVCSLHPAQDVLDGVLHYGVPVGGRLVLVTSERAAHEATALPRGLVLRHTELTASTVSRETALAWLGGGATGSIAQALDALAAFFPRYLVLRDPRVALMLAAWALGTWCYRAFRIYPYLSIRSPEKRCGKTRLLHLLSHVSFNSSPVTAVPTEAQLYRGAARTGGAQLLDEVDGLQGDRERFDALISVLNVGFERAGVVTRLEKRGERFVEVPYEVYAPRALAGIIGLKDTLADRSLPVFMARKRRDEPVARLTAAVEHEAEALQAACALACLTHVRDVLIAADQVPGLLERERVDDRAVDLWSPLVALAVVADAEEGGDRAPRLLALARDLAGLRDADADEGQTARLVAALEAIRQEHGEELTPADLLAALRARLGWGLVETPKRLAGLLNPLGFCREDHRAAKPRYVYRLDADQLADLRARYGGPDDAAEWGES